MGKWKNLSIGVFVAMFGYRAELDFVPFKFAKPQVGFSPSLARAKRLPSFKIGPLHFWTMTADNVEIGIDFRAFFHTTPFSEVYENSFVWPKYSNKDVE